MTDTKNTSKPGSKVAKRVNERLPRATEAKTADKASVPVKKTAAKKAPQSRIKGVAPIADVPGTKKPAPTKLSGPMQAALATAADALKDLPSAPAAPAPVKKERKAVHVKLPEGTTKKQAEKIVSKVVKKTGSKSEHIAPRGQTTSMVAIDEAASFPADQKKPAAKKRLVPTQKIAAKKAALTTDGKTLLNRTEALIKEIRAAGGEFVGAVTIDGLVFHYNFLGKKITAAK